MQETLRVTGAFGRLWQVRVALEWRSSSVAVGLVDYAHQGTQLCPKPLPGCWVDFFGEIFWLDFWDC